MAYITGSHLGMILPATFTATSNPKITELDDLVVQVSNQIDSAAAAAGYAVPISSTTASISFNILSLIAEQGAGWHALKRMFPNMGGPNDQQSLASEYRKSFRDALENLSKGQLRLPDAAYDPNGGRELPRSYSTSNSLATSGVTPNIPMSWQP